MAEKVVIPPEELKKLSREARIRRLRELEEERKKLLEDKKLALEERKQELEQRRKELEEELKKSGEEAEEEIQAAQELIEETEKEFVDEAPREAAARDRRRLEEQLPQEEEGLEGRVGRSRAGIQEEAGRQYEQPNLYRTLEEDIQQLQSLYGTPQWTMGQQQFYQEAKARIEKIQNYTFDSEELAELRGIATGAFNKLRYKHG